MDQEKIKRIFLALLLALAGLYITYLVLIEPKRSEINRALQQIEELQGNLRKGRGMRQAVETFEKQLSERETLINEFFANQQKGSPLAWVPPQIESFFARQGLKAVVKADGEPKMLDATMPNLLAYGWSVDLVAVDFIKLGTAIAAFENSYPLAQINSLRITPSSQSPSLQTCNLKFTGIIRN